MYQPAYARRHEATPFEQLPQESERERRLRLREAERANRIGGNTGTVYENPELARPLPQSRSFHDEESLRASGTPFVAPAHQAYADKLFQQLMGQQARIGSAEPRVQDSEADFARYREEAPAPWPAPPSSQRFKAERYRQELEKQVEDPSQRRR